MSFFDVSIESEPYGGCFVFACGLSIIAGSCFLYLFLSEEERLDEIEKVYDSLIQNYQHYTDYQEWGCSVTHYHNDSLLQKISNTDRPLGASYEPKLVTVPSAYTNPKLGVQKLRPEVLAPLQEMLGGAKLQGLDLRVNSAYRSYKLQDQTYQEYGAGEIKHHQGEHDRAARAGYSEHQLGTAVDISAYPKETRAGYDWLRNNAHRYGFALSYPEGAEELTKFTHEPWHWRYVGRTLAQHIHQQGIVFNHERALFLPSPDAKGSILPYEYQGNDLWVWKAFGSSGVSQATLIHGSEQTEWEEVIVEVPASELANYLVHTYSWESQADTHITVQDTRWRIRSINSPNHSMQLEILQHPTDVYVIALHTAPEQSKRVAQAVLKYCQWN